ncbi:alpha/beta hydrolase [Urechidicola croceus]|uniref:Phospholipase n=1 Tax=Urechidicola croceus TaxID=1850246 RepID=A0A1D8PBR0_9FLAO|nr:alpha/beta fold hydrolase [Urechidicola croceus]AOW21965.1 phospholipase [Urechidicola croceus]
MTKKLSLEYIIRQPIKKTENPPLLILLHGYGSNEQDLFSFASELPEELLIISARAPLTLGAGAFAWYTIHFDMNNGKFSDTEEAIDARDKIATFIDEIKETYNTNPEKTFLLGFSQGTILSYAVALNYPNKVQHVIALSGYLNLDLIPKETNEDLYKNLDFFISHGTVDQVIPVEWAQNAQPFLSKLNIKHSYQEYMVGHGVAPQNFYAFKKWIEERL